jgi:opacity protein-like surface antigen
MKPYLIIVLSFILNLSSYSQHEFGIKADGGISMISNSSLPSNQGWTNKYMPSYNLGLYYKKHFNDKSSIGIELCFERIQDKKTYNYPWVDPGLVYSTNYHLPDIFLGKAEMNLNTNYYNGSGFYSRQISFLSMPVYYGYTYKKFTFNLGIQPSFCLTGSGEFNGYIEGNFANHQQPFKPYYFDDKYTKIVDLGAFDFGLRIGINYKITSDLSVECDYYYGLINITEKKDFDPITGQDDILEIWKVQQLTLGLRYNF